MEVLNLARLFWRWNYPYISLTGLLHPCNIRIWLLGIGKIGKLGDHDSSSRVIILPTQTIQYYKGNPSISCPLTIDSHHWELHCTSGFALRTMCANRGCNGNLHVFVHKNLDVVRRGGSSPHSFDFSPPIHCSCTEVIVFTMPCYQTLPRQVLEITWTLGSRLDIIYASFIAWPYLHTHTHTNQPNQREASS